MSNNFEVTIGIEIHIELNTKSKMFSSSPNKYNSSPNTNLSIIDLGYPGALPTVNKDAVKKAIKLAKALNMEIDHELHFDRKHYFYPDLPKGFQITQQFRPIGKNGEINVNGKLIKIERIHLEEDTAKSIHKGDKTLLDYNRAGVPLIEIVTYPVMSSAEEAGDYIETIRNLVNFIDISDAKMEEGSLRADVNVSIRPHGQKEYGTKVEIKNINSISNSKKAVMNEIKIQEENLLNGFKIEQATKRFDDTKNENIVMRIKKEAVDYKYFPEPNIPPIMLTKDFVDSIKIETLPSEIKEDLKKIGVENELINQIINDKQKLQFINSINSKDKLKAIKIFFAEVVSLANKNQVSINELKISTKEFGILLQKQNSGEISGSHIKKIIPLLMNNAKVVDIIEEYGFKQISDTTEINKIIKSIVEDNADFINNNIDRYERTFKFILGQAMKISNGQINPQIASKLVKIEVENYEKKTKA